MLLKVKEGPVISEAQLLFTELQEKLLDHYGVRARSLYVDFEELSIKAHVLEAGQGNPIVTLHGARAKKKLVEAAKTAWIVSSLRPILFWRF